MADVAEMDDNHADNAVMAVLRIVRSGLAQPPRSTRMTMTLQRSPQH
ncbi:MAG: hypothetical protein ABIR54_22970 [Burkholderiaceae bacterium]